MTKNLDELKDKLYKAFDRAITASENHYYSIEVQAKQAVAAAEIAKAIAAVETRLDDREQQKNGLRLPGKL